MISTHILDTSIGKPASGVVVRLYIKTPKDWNEISQGKTNPDGRLSFSIPKEIGMYQIQFEVEDYFKSQSRNCFFLNVPVAFKVENTNQNYHVPLLLNPFGYSTYRGS